MRFANIIHCPRTHKTHARGEEVIQLIEKYGSVIQNNPKTTPIEIENVQKYT
jgi:hypothetical protein